MGAILTCNTLSYVKPPCSRTLRFFSRNRNDVTTRSWISTARGSICKVAGVRFRRLACGTEGEILSVSVGVMDIVSVRVGENESTESPDPIMVRRVASEGLVRLTSGV